MSFIELRRLIESRIEGRMDANAENRLLDFLAGRRELAFELIAAEDARRRAWQPCRRWGTES
jgi:hypothetical protein